MLTLALLLASIPLVAADGAVPAAPAPAQAEPAPPAFTSLTDDFDRFVTETAALPMPERVRQFRARFNALFPGFYAPRNGATEAQYDARVEKALTAYPANRDKFLAAARDFNAAYASGTARFRRLFPDYAPTMPIYLVHSLNEMDGGTRQLNGKVVAVFGADVIPRYHDSDTIGPFLDHELFHFHHAKFFPDCDQLWCSIWQEGLAVYVASRMNPGADDRMLMLTTPKPIRPAVDAQFSAAMCFARDNFESTAPAIYSEFFLNGGTGVPYPTRFGYYLGYRIAQKMGETHSLQQLATMTPDRVEPLMLKAIGELARCAKS